MTLGCILAITGFCLYSNAKIAAQKAPRLQHLPVVSQDKGFTQEKLLEVVTSDDLSSSSTQRSCATNPIFNLFQKIPRRFPVKTSKTAKTTAFVVADSSTRDVEQTGLYRAGSSTLPLQDGEQMFGKNGFSSAFLSSTTHRNGESHTVYPPGKVRPVPDQSVLELPATAAPSSTTLAPRSYEALQVFDGAPRGYSLVQPV